MALVATPHPAAADVEEGDRLTATVTFGCAGAQKVVLTLGIENHTPEAQRVRIERSWTEPLIATVPPARLSTMYFSEITSDEQLTLSVRDHSTGGWIYPATAHPNPCLDQEPPDDDPGEEPPEEGVGGDTTVEVRLSCSSSEVGLVRTDVDIENTTTVVRLVRLEQQPRDPIVYTVPAADEDGPGRNEVVIGTYYADDVETISVALYDDETGEALYPERTFDNPCRESVGEQPQVPVTTSPLGEDPVGDLDGDQETVEPQAPVVEVLSAEDERPAVASDDSTSLPRTGGDTTVLLVLGLAMSLAGVALLVAGVRRRAL